jgi:signal transduction histidine kinase
MLEFSRESHAPFEALDLEETLRQSVEMVRFALVDRGVEVEMDISPALPQIGGNRLGLQQVFINLFSNARQAMRDGGKLTVGGRLDATGSRVVVTVADTGAGISPEDLDRIFDPFFTTKDVGEGTGLGLSISYGIIKEHGGEIVVESTPGQGSVFTISLPVSRQNVTLS